MRISDWSSDVCSSDLRLIGFHAIHEPGDVIPLDVDGEAVKALGIAAEAIGLLRLDRDSPLIVAGAVGADMQGMGDMTVEIPIALIAEPLVNIDFGRPAAGRHQPEGGRSEEHTSELQSLMRLSYAV